LTFKQEYFEGYKLSWAQKVILALTGQVKIFSVDMYGKGPLDYYAFKCPEHGLVISSVVEYSSKLFCPYCPIFDGEPREPNKYEKIKVS
jgi:hypothetical protein